MSAALLAEVERLRAEIVALRRDRGLQQARRKFNRARAETAEAALLAKSAEYDALVAELATERDLHNRIARNFDHYSKEWVALKDAVDAAPVAMTDGYAVWTTEGMEDLPDWRRKVRVRLLLVREGGDGK